MNLPCVCIVTDAQKTNLNLTFAAMGMGPETFTRKCCAIDPGATDATPPTHWLMSYVGATDSDVAIYQEMTAGNLPPLPEGTVWGENGVISAANAMTASDGAVFHVYSAAGVIEPVDHVAAVLASEGLQYVPDPPL
jgi:hypothetical protein